MSRDVRGTERAATFRIGEDQIDLEGRHTKGPAGDEQVIRGRFLTTDVGLGYRLTIP